MSVLIVGGEGNMGKRYRAVLSHIGKDYIVYDLNNPEKPEYFFKNTPWEAAIVCTPTDTHFEILKKIIPFKKPVLCEKPISKNIEEVKQIYKEAEFHGSNLSMVFNYAYALSFGSPSVASKTNGPHTGYDYYKTGNDGLFWDCIQIVGLDQTGKPVIKNESPVWQCAINGVALDLTGIDFSYIEMIQDWLRGTKQNVDHIIKTHEKVKELENVNGN